MNPVALDLGPLTISTYTAWLGAGILLALGLLLWRAYRERPGAALPWLDVALVALAAGLIGARLLHVWLNWTYFADHTGEIARVSSGGLDWHGALLVGLPAAWLAAQIRRVPFARWTDAAAMGWPLAMIAAWLACRRAGTAYGYEVRTLADYPGWLVTELPDIYGIIAPRLEVQRAGAAFGLVLLALILLIAWRGWLPGLRLWLILALTGTGLFFLGFFRADPTPMLLDHRADQVFDLALLGISTATGGLIWLRGRRENQEQNTEA
ncbi:prolipoprotein diacylglyceryl transferase family protein [Aggregatilinea lenta]|uniref:prolipoprotein diacylglyceryl transferase family protein n=1 Tax=Aggregatilinea lenta TaxID=913108 RepID=UPI000E5BB1E3|nr:prolipoprotein diacylglyceryl transferase family protein [Aggregatilinea lenta]